MSIHFHPLRITEVRKETPECVSVLFDVPDELKKLFAFRQGQSLTMRMNLNNAEIRRTYSICSSPLENEWRVAIKKMEGGMFSTYANEKLKVGDILDVMPPVGKFYTELNPAQKKNYLAFAAGSGITPILSLIKTTLAVEKQSRFTLVFGNSTRSSIIFFEELEALKNKYIDRFNLLHIISREKADTELNTGRITVEKLDDLGKLINYKMQDEIFICGPEQMIFCIKDYMEASGIDKKKIHFELFTTPGQDEAVKQQAVQKELKPRIETGAKSRIGIKLDGRVIEFDLSMDSESTILDAALKQGADLPFACKGGVCTTCKAKLLKGEVEMDVHWGLEDDEVKQGFILTCQSHPKSASVLVDFDIK